MTGIRTPAAPPSSALAEYIKTHRKWIAGAALAGLTGGLTYAVGANSIWVAVIIPAVAAYLGINYTPNKKKPAADDHPGPGPAAG